MGDEKVCSNPLLIGASDEILESKIKALETENNRIMKESEDLSSRLAETLSLLETVNSTTSAYSPAIKSSYSSSENLTSSENEVISPRTPPVHDWSKVLRKKSASSKVSLPSR